MRILSYKLGVTRNATTSRAGLLALAELLRKVGLAELARTHLPKARGKLALGADEMLVSMVHLLHNDGKCLDDIRGLHAERDLLRVAGLSRLPSVRTLGSCLHRWGKDPAALDGLAEISRRLLALALRGRTEVTLDIDATAIEADRKEAKWTYKKHKGYMPMVGHVAETGQVAAIDFRDGNAPPSKDNLGFIRQCEAALPAGVSVRRVRIDAAGYSADVVNYLMQSGQGFAIRAKMDASVKESMSAIRDGQWEALVHADGTRSKTQEAARTLHAMADTGAFTLAERRKRIAAGENAHIDAFVDAGGNAASRGAYLYRAIATNLDGKTDHEIVQWYNLRGETSENKIKQLRSDFAGARLPCGKFGANAVWLMVNALAYNLLCLLRMMLPARWLTARAPALRFHLYGAGGHVVRHGRQLTVKVQAHRHRVIGAALRSIREFALPA